MTGNIDWQQPYAASRSPVIARNVVATSQPLATAAGLRVLHDGGNAVDAALAAAITLTVVEPNNNGIGSDAFALVHDGNKLHGLNGSGRSPSRLDMDRLLGMSGMPTHGWDAVTVPGAVSAWDALSERFGVLPFENLFNSAIHYAESGFHVGPKSGPFWQHAVRRFKDRRAFQETFSINGRAPETGELFKLADHGKTLRDIALTRGESFYRGALAERIAADAAANNATLSLDDLDAHSVDWVESINQCAFDYKLHEIPPNGQGLMALISLGIVARRYEDDFRLDSADAIHLQIEAQRIAFCEMQSHLADPDYMQFHASSFLDDDYLDQKAGEIEMSHANPRPVALGAAPDTVYLTAADENGLMVSMIQSNYMGFGSGVVIPGTGISMQNRGAGFVLTEGHPNQIGPQKRPYHTIIPGFVTDVHDAPMMSFGVMGGHMQAQGHLQMMIRIFKHGQNPQAASDAPRWHVYEDGRVALEDGFDPAVAQSLRERGHDIVTGRPEYLFGGAQLIQKVAGGYCAGSDHRKEGHAAGF